MAMAKTEGEFDSWLKKKLTDFDTDEEVWFPYIKGILDGDETEEEQKDGLDGVLSGVIEGDYESLSRQIFEVWTNCKEHQRNAAAQATSLIDIDQRLADLLEDTKIKTVSVGNVKELSNEQKQLKAAILSQYSQVSDGEEDVSDDGGQGAGAAISLSKNTNAENVDKAVRDQRDKDKEDSQKKKEKDKEDRARQKGKDDDRKEKEKTRTQKVEKRR